MGLVARAQRGRDEPLGFVKVRFMILGRSGTATPKAVRLLSEQSETSLILMACISTMMRQAPSRVVNRARHE